MNDYNEILLFISSEIGLNPDSIGLMSIARGISNSMKNSGIANPVEFTAKIKTDKLLFKELIEEIKVPETWFFRDVECYNYIKNHINTNRKNISQTNPLRILSAPCSTGEEPYSATMLALNCGLNPNEIEIIGTDLSSNSIEFAKSGLYRKSSFRCDYDDFQYKYFSTDGQNYQIHDNVRNIPVYFEDNIVKNTFLEQQLPFDFIFCKNVLIYLNDESRSKVLDNICRLLKSDGTLLVGLSEINYFTRNGFEQIKHNMAFACKKSSTKLSENVNKNNFYNTVKPNIPKLNSNTHQRIKSTELSFKEKIETVSKSTYTIENVKEMADKGDFKQAEKICETLIKHEYSNSDALYYMGLIQNALHNSALASDYFKKVLYLKPDHYESLVHISLIYEASGDSARALLFRERAERVYLKNMNHLKGSSND